MTTIIDNTPLIAQFTTCPTALEDRLFTTSYSYLAAVHVQAPEFRWQKVRWKNIPNLPIDVVRTVSGHRKTVCDFEKVRPARSDPPRFTYVL